MRKLCYLVCCLLLAVVACRPTPEPPTATPISLSGRITFAGSTTVQPLADKLGQAFRNHYPGVTLEIAAGGSVVGINAVHEGTVDIGMASRALKTDEAEGITTHQIAVDVVAVIVNAGNPVASLTMDQLRDIYLGQITNWSEVGGRNEAIAVVIREKSSGTRGAFDDIVLDGQEPAISDVITAITAGDVAAAVLQRANAIGYVGFGNLEPGLKPVAIDQVLPSDDSARDGSYPLTRPLLLLTGPLTQPLALTFVEFAGSVEGQQVVAANGWVPAK